MAINLNNSNAMYNFGYYHEQITKDYKEMEKYYLMANNNINAIIDLLLYYLKNKNNEMTKYIYKMLKKQ